MKLELRIVAFKSFHLDNSSLLEVGKSKLFTFDVGHTLHDLCQGVNDINQVVALVENNVNKRAAFSEAALEASLQDIVHKVRMRLVTNLKNVVLIHQSKSGRSSLEVVESESHITVGCENKSLKTIICMLDSFLVKNNFESLKDFFIIELGKSDNCTS